MSRRRSSTSTEPRVPTRGSGPLGAACQGPRGYSLVEILVVMGIVTVVLIAAVPGLTRAADTADGAGAARYVASVVALARFEAARRQRVVAVRFLRTTPPTFVRIVDGDGDGVTTADIAAGIDRTLGPADRVEDHYPRARFGIGRAVTAIDDTRTLNAGDDPIRFGVADQLSVSPIGGATSGTAYVVSQGGAQYAVRVSGVTGRARVLQYDRGLSSWRPY